MIHSYELIIRESHLDTFGHVNNATYLELLEEARWELITAGGYGLERVKETGLGPTILELEMKFKRELCLRQKIRIDTELVSQKSKISRMKQCIFNEANELACEANFVFGLFDTKTRKLVAPTPEWLAVFDDKSSA